MKNKLLRCSYYLMLLSCLVCIISSIYLQFISYTFNPQNVKNTIKILSSEKFAGRLTGSPENNATSSFIEDKFKNYSLNPLDTSYSESFNVTAPVRNNSDPYLIITKDGKPIHKYKYGTDFKENMLNFKSSEATFTEYDNITILPYSIIITQNNKQYLFKVNINNDFSFRSSFNSSSSYEFCINITTELYNDILDSLRNKCNISIKIPYTTSIKSTSNVIGVLKGIVNSKPPLILTAHYDHLGTDYLGNCYGGALDNASGTAFLLELSKSLSSLIKPDRDIIFIALTGEEFGLLGSKDFVSKHYNQIKNADVINFDMIGAPDTPVTFMIGTSAEQLKTSKSSNFLNSLESECSKNNIKYNVKIQDSSDHSSFNDVGINALTICHSDLSKIHTPKDQTAYIDPKAISEIYTITKNEIYNCAYNRYILLLYNPIVTFIVLIILLLCIIIKNFKKYHNKLNTK